MKVLTDNTSHLYNIPGYNLKYKNIPDSARGGVVMYTKLNYNVKLQNDLSIFVPGVESICIEVQLNHCNAIIAEILQSP